METVITTGIRDFRIRGNYLNWRSLLSRRERHSSKQENPAPNLPGYSPPIVDFELYGGTTSSIAVSESDIPLLCDDVEKAKRCLSLILEARQGDPRAAKELSSVAQQYPLEGTRGVEPSESRFVVPCTSRQPHSEQAISQKGFILLKLCQLGYPVPDFVVLTSQAYVDRAERLEQHMADGIKQRERGERIGALLTMRDAESVRRIEDEIEISRRHRYARELADVPPTVDVHVLPTGGGSARDDSPLAYRDLKSAMARINRAYDASAMYLTVHL